MGIAHHIGYIANLEKAGKISTQEAYKKVRELWTEDNWVNQENEKIAQTWSQQENKTNSSLQKPSQVTSMKTRKPSS